MADKKYVSIINNGSVALYLRDTEAHLEIDDLKSSMTGAMRYIGKSIKPISEGSTEKDVSNIKDAFDGSIAVPTGTQAVSYARYPEYDVKEDGNISYYAWKSQNSGISGLDEDGNSIGPDGEYFYVYTSTSNITTNTDVYRTTYGDNPNEGLDIYDINITNVYKNLKNGDVIIYQDKEFVWDGTKWSEFGSTGSLKALAFKDSATGSVTAAGSNAASAVTLTGGSTSKLATTSITPVSGTESVSAVSSTSSKLATTTIKGVAGTESVSKVTKTSSKLVTTTITGVGGSATVHDTPTLTKTAITPVGGTGTVHDTPTLTKSSIGSASGWNAGSLPSMSYNEATETLTFGAGSLPTLTVTSTQVGTGLTAGDEKTFATAGTSVQVGTGLTAGTEKTFATAASSSTTVATGSASSEGSGADIVTGVSITDKTVATAASSNTTVATGATSDSGSGAAIVTSVTATDKTVAKAGTAVTVATGAVAANGSGATVVTASPTGGTAAAQTFTGSAVSVTVS